MFPTQCPPGLRWHLRLPGHLLGHSGLTDLDPKLEKFAADARCAPQRVLPRHAPDQCPDLRRDWRAASSPGTWFPSPEGTKALAVPSNYRFRFDDNHGIKTTRPEAIQEEPKSSVRSREPKPSRTGASENFQLMTQGDDLEP